MPWRLFNIKVRRSSLSSRLKQYICNYSIRTPNALPANETFRFLFRRDRVLSSDKRPNAISRRRLALKLSLTASIHFGERSRALSSTAEASTSSLTHWIFMCRYAARPPLTLFVHGALATERSFDGCTYATQHPFTAWYVP